MKKKENKLLEEIAHLARIGLSGRAQDVQAYVHRISKKYREDHPEFATELTELLRKSPTRSSPLRKKSEVALPVDSDSRFQLLRLDDKPELDHEPVYAEATMTLLQQLVKERLRETDLRNAGLEPAKTALFTGPPGVGKTLAAKWLARSLDLPLIVLDLSAVMSSYLGRTGSNLRHVLEYAKSVDCVLLLDELDAIAKRRDDRGEIGELKRLVTVLLQQLDDWPSSGLLVAATNHSELLDPAVWRRFETVVTFPLPSAEAAECFISAQLDELVENADRWARALSLVSVGKSFSEMDHDIKAARRSAALANGDLEDHLGELCRRSDLPKADRIALASCLANDGLVSQRQASELTGVSRDTIRSRVASKNQAPKCEEAAT